MWGMGFRNPPLNCNISSVLKPDHISPFSSLLNMPPELVSRYVLQICIKYEKLISALVLKNGLSCTYENSWASFILSGGQCVVE